MSQRLKLLAHRVAWASLIASFPVWTAAFVVVPFLNIPVAQRGALAGGLLVAGEVMFWGAGLVLGKAALARFRKPRVNTGTSFAGKRVAVLGATGGLGSAIARAAVREGATVVLVARDRQKLEPLAQALKAELVIADITDPVALAEARLQLGELDHVVCATGIDVRKSLASHSSAEIHRELQVDLLGPILVVQALLDNLRERGSIALLGGFGDGGLAFPYHSVNVAARAGLAGFCESVNRELALSGRSQRLSYLSPAPADTEAERPYAKFWTEMGTSLVPVSKVADFVLVTLLTRKATAVMGASARLLTFVNALSPRLADLLAMRRLGARLKAEFGDLR